jgi:hypothetical protein
MMLTLLLLTLLVAFLNKCLGTHNTKDTNPLSIRFWLVHVSQGSVLAPLLYIVFIDDIVDFFRKRGRYISITTATTIATLLFADDLALPTGINDTGTQQLLDDLRLYAAASRFRVNIIKTVIMDAPVPSLTPLPPPSPFFLSPPAGPNNSYLPVQLPLSTVSSVRYLGIELGGTPAFLITHVKKKYKLALRH